MPPAAPGAKVAGELPGCCGAAESLVETRGSFCGVMGVCAIIGLLDMRHSGVSGMAYLFCLGGRRGVLLGAWVFGFACSPPCPP